MKKLVISILFLFSFSIFASVDEVVSETLNEFSNEVVLSKTARALVRYTDLIQIHTIIVDRLSIPVKIEFAEGTFMFPRNDSFDILSDPKKSLNDYVNYLKRVNVKGN
ncbi:MAG: hypothetical protein KAQ98_12245 [Bacteriovoracaceae bacterium]|nr:hypothetical protein [Bacteriovoracaceae bacterium]